MIMSVMSDQNCDAPCAIPDIPVCQSRDTPELTILTACKSNKIPSTISAEENACYRGDKEQIGPTTSSAWCRHQGHQTAQGLAEGHRGHAEPSPLHYCYPRYSYPMVVATAVPNWETGVAVTVTVPPP